MNYTNETGEIMSTDANSQEPKVDSYVLPNVESPKPSPIVEELEVEQKTIVIIHAHPDQIEAAKAIVLEASKTGVVPLPHGLDYSIQVVPAHSTFVIQDVAKAYKFREKSV